LQILLWKSAGRKEADEGSWAKSMGSSYQSSQGVPVKLMKDSVKDGDGHSISRTKIMMSAENSREFDYFRKIL
jgi:hypothetical protein